MARLRAVHTARILSVCVVGLALVAGCVATGRPTGVALELDDALRSANVAHGERISSPSVYAVLASTAVDWLTFEGCGPDIGGGVRCTFTPDACDNPYDKALTMHLDVTSKGVYHVTSAAVTGIVRTVEYPDIGPVFFVEPCGLTGMYSQSRYRELGPFLSSEIYSSTLVPWPYAELPTTRADTALAMSRLAVNRAAIDAAMDDLRQALRAGEPATTVVTTAAVEAGFTLGLRLTPSWRVASQGGVRPVWPHDADAYPTDTAQLRQGIALLDFAMHVAHPGVDWHDVAVLGGRGRDITFTHTPSIAAMEEMNGVAHYVLGRVLLDAAARLQTCDLWTSAHDALQAGYGYLTKVPRVDEADNADAHLVSAIEPLVQRADTTRVRVCRATA